MSSGWIKIHRKLKRWEWYSDTNTTRVFLHLLLCVNREDGEHQGVHIPVGSVKTGRIILSRELGLSEQQTRRALKNLQKSQDITIKATNKYSMIAVNNWDSHQQDNQQATSKRSNKQPAKQPINNHKQEVENREVEKREVKEDFVSIVLSGLSESKTKSMTEWMAYKKERGQSYKKTGLERLAKSWDKYSDKVIDIAVESSITNNWAGLFPEKVDYSKSTQTKQDHRHVDAKKNYMDGWE